jgi:hypothetical protein
LGEISGDSFPALNNKTTNSFATKIGLSVAVVLMRDINQKASNTDKQIAFAPSAVPKPFAFRRSVWLSYLQSRRVISTGGLSVFAVAALLGIKPAQANITDQSAGLPNLPPEKEQASPTSSQSSGLEAQSGFPIALRQEESNETARENVQTLADLSSNQSTSELLNLNASDSSVVKTFKTDAPKDAIVIPGMEISGTNTKPAPTEYNFAPYAIKTGNFSSLQPQPATEDAAITLRAVPFVKPLPQEKAIVVPLANSLSFGRAGTTPQNSNPQAIGTEFSKPATSLPAVPSSTEEAEAQNVVKDKVASNPGTQTEQPTTILPGFSLEATAFSKGANAVEDKVASNPGTQTEQPSTVLPGFSLEATAFAPDKDAVEYKVWDPSVSGKQPKAILPPFAYQADAFAQLENPAKPRVPLPLAGGTQPTMVAQATAPDATAATGEPYSGPGAARLLGDTIQAQSDARKLATATLSVDAAQEAQSQNAAQTNNPLAPSLIFQGGFITQKETGARARLTGLYPVSPNLLFGGTVDLTTGEGFSDTPGTGLDITELYFTASLPSYPNLRLTAGILDLTSYFDRNSFAKDSLTHFFHPVFQTNPALARTGIASRPAALLNWDITDNLNARAAAFSSSRNLGELAVDGFAGELAARFGNGIIRATYATDRDDQRNGFKEIFGINRGNGEFGPRTSDRESSYGINAEYYIPQIKMGLFGRYGHYENTSLGRGGDTYSAGLNFLDLFMKDDRLGFGYGRDLSSNSLRRASGNKVPDVWEVFYDFRVTPYLRAGVALQARDEFSELVAGFRVKTEFDLLNLGRTFR